MKGIKAINIPLSFGKSIVDWLIQHFIALSMLILYLMIS